ncbi:hypothetical protein DWF00_09175 [Bosea caraganae]|uniref:Uncharacterized protein n=1 Tax=Bosea caraganae TaxID=2763117 RepID=A0A370LBB5_9HYPH|nr:hypothetical protein [Bosea caraganae]RDJ27161.1 hypothetical protein DWF00_09175 [Bosea caraganae]RDJ29178.1 hypothetical protein DWE98_00950 [Bosea caraganae]
MTEPTLIELAIFADYFQFYVQDEAANEDFGEKWTDESVERQLAVAEFSAAIGTARNMTVPVVLSVHAEAPAEDFAEWDMVNECSISVRSDTLIIAGCTDHLPNAPRVPIAPGTYRVRVSYSGLDSLSEDGVEGDDFYRLQLWPAPLAEIAVRKARTVAAD